jgi:hypothetical protein
MLAAILIVIAYAIYQHRKGRSGTRRPPRVRPVNWQPGKLAFPLRSLSGPGKWDEQDHGLDYPGALHTPTSV